MSEKIHVELKEIPFSKSQTINDIESFAIGNNRRFLDYPVDYLIYNDVSMYVGETVNIKQRLKSHLKDKRRSKLNTVCIVYSELFNQSATYNTETNLINHFIADGRFELQNISQTNKVTVHNYYNKEQYNKEMFNQLWKKLQEIGLARKSLEEIRNSDVFKLSPYKELNTEQMELRDEIVGYCKENINAIEPTVLLIEGDAGTGKSVLLSSTFNLIQDLASENDNPLSNHKNNYLLVNHNEMLKTYQSISKSLPNLRKKNFLRPTTFINRMDKAGTKAEIVLVDEAHLLLTKKDSFNSFNYDNHMDEIIRRSKVTVIIYDTRQVLKAKSYWNKSQIDRVKSIYKTETFYLTNQMRISANKQTLKWLDEFTCKKIEHIPHDHDFELRVFDDASEMYRKIRERNDEVGLSRIVSTFDFEHKKDGEKYFVESGSFKLPWNGTNYVETWAENENSINEVGSIYTIQGFDLNYVGVILGPSVGYDEKTKKLQVMNRKYKDTGAFSGAGDFENPDMIKDQIILNSINVLIKRGIKGLYIYATDDSLRKYLLTL